MIESPLLTALDWSVFTALALCVGYLLMYAVAALFYRPASYPAPKKQHKFAVLFPAYKADEVIRASVQSFLNQDYPRELYDVIVIADQMRAQTCDDLRQLGAQVLVATYAESTKAKALILAMQSIRAEAYGMVVIMDADNTTVPSFLTEINRAYDSGVKAIQAHRTAKNLNTDIALLDAASEEINNGIFRKGHVAMGLSCALIGSGMAIDAQWMAQHVERLQTAGEDKEFEAMLQRERVGVAYLSEVPVYDEKTQKQSAISQQRKRWIATQLGSLRHTLPELPKAFFTGNISYADKIVQWMLPPRLIQLGAVIGLTIAVTFTTAFAGSLPGAALKWWLLAVAQILAMTLPLPKELAGAKLLKALLRMPFLVFSMVLNLFRLKGANQKFIHTEHGSTNK